MHFAAYAAALRLSRRVMSVYNGLTLFPRGECFAISQKFTRAEGKEITRSKFDLQIRPVAHQDSGGLLLLHKWRARRKARPRDTQRAHGPVHGGGDQVPSANDEQPGRHEGGHSHGRGARRGARTEAMAVRRLQQGRRASEQDGEQRNGRVSETIEFGDEFAALKYEKLIYRD